MKRAIFILFFIFILFYFPNVKSDIISVNNGGSERILINPDNYIEGFFGCVPTTCAKLGYSCDSWSDKCGKIINCGSCTSGFTCSAGICTSITPPPGPGGGPGGSGGQTIPGIVITPSSINITLSYNNVTNMSQRITEKIYITNNGNSAKNLSVSQSGLDFITIIGTNSVNVNPHETKELDIDFVSPLRNEDVSGKIFIDGYNIPVFIHVTSNPLWFDSNIVVLNKNYQVSRGGILQTSVELIPQGDKSRLDVTLNYVIKDSSGKIFLTKSETVLVTDKINFERDFGTGMLPLGNYIISLDLIYPGGIAPSSAQFEVIPMSFGNILGVILFFLISGILITAILIIIFLIKKKKKKENKI